MAYLTHGTSNTSLINSLLTHSLITSHPVKTAMLSIDRGDYLPLLTPNRPPTIQEKVAMGAYEDSPQSIGYGATISAPHMHGMALEYLGGAFSLASNANPHTISKSNGTDSVEGNWLKGKRVLDVGSGSGYLTACLAEMVFGPDSGSDGGEGKNGKVIGIEHIQELRDMGEGNVRKSEKGRRLIEEGRVEFVVGDGREGWRGDGEGYDAIHVGAAAVAVHDALINQLRSPGRIFIPVQDSKGYGQYIWIIDKDVHGTVSRKKLCGVNYVPLTDAPIAR